MYAKVLPGTSFAGLANYLAGEDKDCVAWTQTRNVVAEDPAEVAREMELIARTNERVEQPVRHFVVSFGPQERPTGRAAMQRVARQMLEDLGLEKHQALIVAHDDTPHPHFHVMVNRVRHGARRAWHSSYEGKRLRRSIERQEKTLRRWKAEHPKTGQQKRPNLGRRAEPEHMLAAHGGGAPADDEAASALLAPAFGEEERNLESNLKTSAMPTPSSPDAPEGDNGEAREALRFASRHYAETLRELPESHPAHRYLEERGFEMEDLGHFGIGYAEDSWDDLRRAAAKEGIPAETLAAAGLASERRSGSGHYDRFRGRIMFPVRNAEGQVRGFGGRRVEGMDLKTHSKGEPAKYVNTRKTDLYNKSELFFGLARAREAIEHRGEVTVVEGYTDALRMSRAGQPGVVALAGTRLTEEHAQQLRRLGAGRVTLLLDGDAGGRRAAGPAAEKLLRAGVEPRVTSLPEGEDPGTFVRERGLEALLDYQASEGTTVAEAMLQSAAIAERQRAGGEASAQDVAAARGKAAAGALSSFAGVEDEAQRSFYFQQLTHATRPAGDLTREEKKRHQAALARSFERYLKQAGREASASLPSLGDEVAAGEVLPRAGGEARSFYEALSKEARRKTGARQTPRPTAASSQGRAAGSQAGMISEAKIEEVKQATPLLDLAQEYTPMREASDDDWVGLSPFSSEENPSFHVTPSVGKYYDFSTDQGGDQITLVQRMENVSFPEAVRHLAERAGVDLGERKRGRERQGGNAPRTESNEETSRGEASENTDRETKPPAEQERSRPDTKAALEAVEQLSDDFRERIRAAGDALTEDKTVAAYRLELAERGIHLTQSEEAGGAWTLIDRKSSSRDAEVSLRDVVAARREGRLAPERALEKERTTAPTPGAPSRQTTAQNPKARAPAARDAGAGAKKTARADLTAGARPETPSEGVRRAYRDVQEALATAERPLPGGNAAGSNAEVRRVEATEMLRAYRGRLESYAEGVAHRLEGEDLSPSEALGLQRTLDGARYRTARVTAALRRGERVAACGTSWHPQSSPARMRAGSSFTARRPASTGWREM